MNTKSEEGDLAAASERRPCVTEPLYEMYQMRIEDHELHCMDVMQSALKRNILVNGTPDELPAAKRAVAWLAAWLESQ